MLHNILKFNIIDPKWNICFSKFKDTNFITRQNSCSFVIGHDITMAEEAIQEEGLRESCSTALGKYLYDRQTAISPGMTMWLHLNNDIWWKLNTQIMYADLGKLSTNMMCHRSKTPQPCMGEKNQPSHSFQYGLSDNRAGAPIQRALLNLMDWSRNLALSF